MNSFKNGIIKNPLLGVLVFLTTGISLIFNSGETSNPPFILTMGIVLSVYAILKVFLLIIIPSIAQKLESYDTNLKIFLFPITLLTIYFSILKLSTSPYFELSFILLFCFTSLALIWMLVDLIKIKNFKFGSKESMKIILYRIFSRLGLMSVILGLSLVIFGIIDPELPKSLLALNEWAYNPLLYFAISILCVFPILIFNPK